MTTVVPERRTKEVGLNRSEAKPCEGLLGLRMDMATARHRVSHRNGRQVMVKGLTLTKLGYGFGASVRVTNPDDPTMSAWIFCVESKETATLTSRTMPPDWIKPEVIRDSGATGRRRSESANSRPQRPEESSCQAWARNDGRSARGSLRRSRTSPEAERGIASLA